MKTFLRRVLSGIVIVIFLLSLTPGKATAQSPWFSIDPSSGPAGIGVSIVDGGDFTPDQKGQILWGDDGSVLGDAYTDGKGNPSGTFYIPGDADPGAHDIILDTGIEKAYSSFTVIATKPIDTPVTVPAPSIKQFSLDPQTILAGECATLYWSVSNAQSVVISGDFGTQSVDDSGSLNVCPEKTTTYEINAEGYKDADPPAVSAYAVLTVTTAAISTPTFTPSRTPTKFPGYVNTSTFTPSRTPTLQMILPHVITVIPPSGPQLPPQTFLPHLGDHRCSDLGLGRDAVTIGFDDLSAETSLGNQYGSRGALFVPGAVRVGVPSMGARSPAMAARSLVAEFGGPLAINFPNPVSAVGMFVGRGVPGTTAAVFATLTAYGSNAGGRRVLATDRTLLPNAASPFQDCLVVHAPAGWLIGSVSLDYTTATGQSVVESRWFDDLTFIATGFPSLDRPPQVTISSPANGSRQMANGITLVARVNEDIRLVSVNLSVNAGPLQPLGFRPAAGSDPTLYEVSASLNGLLPDASNTVRVVATDSAGQTGEASSTFYYAGPPGDIWVTGIEVSQSIQTDTNSIPLLGNKSTLVRVYVQSRLDPRGPWNDVTAVLTVRNGGSGTDYTPANNGSRTVAAAGRTYKVITVPTTGSTRIDLESGFYFLLNRADTATGVRDFEVNIFSVSGRPETDTSNNRRSLSLGFILPLSLTIYGVPMVYAPGPSAQWYEDGHWVWNMPQSDFGRFAAHRAVVESVLPLSSFTILPWPGMAVLPARIVSDNLPPAQPPPSFASLAAGRTWAEGILAHRSGSTIIYLLEPVDTCGCGEALRLGGTSNTRINGHDNRSHDGVGRVMAHELGHALGLWWHIVSPPEHTAYEPWNLQYPHANSSIGPQVGINLAAPNAPEVMYYNSGHDMHDLMSYDWPAWISPYDYCELLSNLGANWTCDYAASVAYAPERSFVVRGSAHTAASQALEERPSLYISGWISPDGAAGGFGPFETILSNLEPAAPQPGGIYQVVLQDQDGGILSVYPFDVTHSDGETTEEHRFNLTVPLDPSPASISLHMGDVVLAELSAGDSVPGVVLTSPVGGEDWSGPTTITWGGKGEKPVYSVEYSSDNGFTWIPLATGLTASSLPVDFDNMPGSEQALVRVIASDGINYSSDQSKAPFRVPSKGPQVTLDTPLGGETFTGGLPIIARASGFDWEDGALPDSAFTWSSNLDGALGSGPWIMLPSLSVGEHLLTVTASDSRGNRADAEVRFTVVAPQVEQVAPYSFKPPATFWIVLVGGGAFLAILLLVLLLVLLRRKKSV